MAIDIGLPILQSLVQRAPTIAQEVVDMANWSPTLGSALLAMDRLNIQIAFEPNRTSVAEDGALVRTPSALNGYTTTIEFSDSILDTTRTRSALNVLQPGGPNIPISPAQYFVGLLAHEGPGHVLDPNRNASGPQSNFRAPSGNYVPEALDYVISEGKALYFNIRIMNELASENDGIQTIPVAIGNNLTGSISNNGVFLQDAVLLNRLSQLAMLPPSQLGDFIATASAVYILQENHSGNDSYVRTYGLLPEGEVAQSSSLNFSESGFVQLRITSQSGHTYQSETYERPRLRTAADFEQMASTGNSNQPGLDLNSTPVLAVALPGTSPQTDFSQDSIIRLIPNDATAITILPPSGNAIAIISYDRADGTKVELLSLNQDSNPYTPELFLERITVGASNLPTNVGVIEIQRTLDAGGQETSRSVTKLEYASGSITAEAIGQTLGSVLGRSLGGDNLFAQVGASTIAATILQNVGEFLQKGADLNLINFDSSTISNSPLTDAASLAFGDLIPDLATNFRLQLTSGLSSLLIAEIADALGLDGYGRNIFNIAGTTVTTSVTQNVISTISQTPLPPGGVFSSTENFLGGFDLSKIGINFVNSVGAFFGGELAKIIVTPATTEAALFGSAAAAVGSYVGALALSWIPLIGSFAGSFLGQLIGSWLGNLVFDSDDDREERFDIHVGADGAIETGFIKNVDGSNGQLGQAIATAAAQALNQFIAKNGVVVDVNGSYSPVAVGWGVDTNDEIIFQAERPGINNVMAAPSADILRPDNDELARQTAAEAADLMLSQLYFLGSDSERFVERAFNASRGNGLEQLAIDVQVAKDYQIYVDNTAFINVLIAQTPQSAFALGWLVTLQRAAELAINKVGRSDLMNGIPGFLDNLRLADFSPTNDQDPTFGDITITPAGDGVTLDIALRPTAAVPKRIFDIYGGQAAEIALPDGGRVLRFVLDKATFERGGFKQDFEEFAANGSGATAPSAGGQVLHVRPDEAGESAQNFWVGGTSLPENEYRDNHEFYLLPPERQGQSDFLVGAGIKDTIFGGRGRDWIEGGGGDDALYGQLGDDIVVGGPDNDYMFGDDSTGQIVNGTWVPDVYVAPRASDLFIFRSGFGHDRILDFDLGLDKILFGTAGLRSFAEIQAKIAWIPIADPNGELLLAPGTRPADASLYFNASKIVVAEPLVGGGMQYSTLRVDNVTPDQWTADNFQSRPAPSVTVANIEVVEGSAPNLADGFLSTRGNQIVDKDGAAFQIVGVNWFGLETTDLVPHGLYDRDWRDMMVQMKSLGFNTIRLPFASATLDPNARPVGGVDGGVNLHLNDDLLVSGKYDWTVPIEQQQAITSLEIMDRIIDYAGQIGLKIILDHHRSDLGNSANENGLWYKPGYSEAQWLADWQMLASRYAGNATIIGADLHNEPHGKPDNLYYQDPANQGTSNPTPNPATWGTGDPATDWRLAAEKAGNAIGQVNPDWLIFVEGIETYQDKTYWWGGNLAGAAENPVRLNVANKLVYSPHDYPNSVFPQAWFSDPSYPANLTEKFKENWGFAYESGLAPVFIGEIGTNLEDPKDIAWLAKLIAYLKGDVNADGTSDLGQGELGPSFAWWSWNPQSGDTGGILQDDWHQVETAKLAALRDLLLLNQNVTHGSQTATFTVTLSTPATEVVSLDYRTAPTAIRATGAAVSGGDFNSVQGTLIFQPGQQSETISVNVFRDTLDEGDQETFLLILSNAKNAILGPDQTLTAVATIKDDDAVLPPNAPYVVYGDGQANTLLGVVGRNAIYGADNNDTVIGQQSGDLLSGDAGDDQIYAEGGNDLLTGETGNDTLSGGLGSDWLYGGAGHDWIDGGVGDDYLNGGEGFDWSSYDSATSSVTVNLGLTTKQNTGGAGIDVLFSIESLYGSGYNDTLFGDATSNNLYGSNGDDTIWSLGGLDFINGGSGDDTIYGAPGTSVMVGAAGNDQFVIYDLATTLQENVNEGADTAWVGVSGYVVAANIEIIRLTASGTSVTGSAVSEQIVANSFYASSLNGSGGNDVLYGSAYNDTFVGGDGDDIIYGQGGIDLMVGGTGNDQYVVVDNGTVVTENDNAGDDTIWVGVNGYGVGAHIERINLTGASNTAIGNNQNNIIAGNAAMSNAYLVGYGGDDIIYGSSFNDLFRGDAGNDTFYSQGGADIFVYDGPGWGYDGISGFVVGSAKLDFRGSGIGFGQLYIQSANGNTQVEYGNSAILVFGAATLGSGDFLF